MYILLEYKFSWDIKILGIWMVFAVVAVQINLNLYCYCFSLIIIFFFKSCYAFNDWPMVKIKSNASLHCQMNMVVKIFPFLKYVRITLYCNCQFDRKLIDCSIVWKNIGFDICYVWKKKKKYNKNNNNWACEFICHHFMSS